MPGMTRERLEEIKGDYCHDVGIYEYHGDGGHWVEVMLAREAELIAALEEAWREGDELRKFKERAEVYMASVERETLALKDKILELTGYD